MARALLVHSFYPSPRIISGLISHSTHPPLGISYISAFLKNIGHEVTCCDVNIDGTDAVFNILSERKYDLVGFSTNAGSIKWAFDMARLVKQKFGSVKIVIGGVATAQFSDWMVHSVIDALVIGDGEETLAGIMACIDHGISDWRTIDGLVLNYQGKVMFTPSACPRLSLDELPFPDREAFDLKVYLSGANKSCYITTSRGCPNECIFCGSGKGGRPYRFRSIQNVVDEIKGVLAKYPFYKTINFVDETLNVSPSRLRSLCLEMKKIGVKWICCLRAESTLTNEDLELLKDSGCRMIEIGIESANQGVLDKIGKRTRLADIERILKKAAELEIIIIGMLMVPHHVDTPQTVFETVKKIEEWVNTTTLIPMAFQTMVPANTEFSKMLLGYPGIRISQDEKIMETSTVSATLIAEALRKLINLSKAACIRNAYTLAKNMDLDLSSLADNITDEMELRFKTEPVLPV